MSLTLVVPDRSGLGPSGGDRYDETVVAQWRRQGRRVEVHAVPGAWPWPTTRDVARLADLTQVLPPGPVLLDGLVGCAVPEVVERSAAVRPTVVLVHSLLADGAGAEGEQAAELDRRERRALAAAHGVVVTSAWSRARLAERHGVVGAAVARPGTLAAPVAPGTLTAAEDGVSGTGGVRAAAAPSLLSLGAVAPLKNHRTLLTALADLTDLPWTLVVAGPAPDCDHLSALRGEAARRGLAARVSWTGPLEGEALEHVWGRTDLLVHPSRSETYGLVVAEALARGIPAVVGSGTGAVEALTGSVEADGTAGLPGAAVSTHEPQELSRVLRRWFCDPGLRRRWRAAALARRDRVPGWDRTVVEIDRLLRRIAG